MWRAKARPRASHQLTIANDCAPNLGLTWILFLATSKNDPFLLGNSKSHTLVNAVLAFHQTPESGAQLGRSLSSAHAIPPGAAGVDLSRKNFLSLFDSLVYPFSESVIVRRRQKTNP